MRKGLIVLLLSMTIFCIAGIASADNSAVLSSGFDCYVGTGFDYTTDAGGYTNVLGYTIETNYSQVVANNGGNLSLVCQFTLLDVTWKKALKAKGFTCYIPSLGMTTTDSYFVADTLGNAVLNCQIKL